mmetsp:Transcript_1952/g.5201  ORF Transcript_1952/g.5201 Transcript_1952/m.5201 type:complete len:205 (+) Transcript_1952:442-1056(+)
MRIWCGNSWIHVNAGVGAAMASFAQWLRDVDIARFTLLKACYGTRPTADDPVFAFVDNNVSEANQERIKSKLRRSDGRIRGDIATVIEKACDIDRRDALNMVDRPLSRLVTRGPTEWGQTDREIKRKKQVQTVAAKGMLHNFGPGEEEEASTKQKKTPKKPRKSKAADAAGSSEELQAENFELRRRLKELEDREVDKSVSRKDK